MSKIDAVLDDVIRTYITLSKKLDNPNVVVRISKSDLGIERWTAKRKNEMVTQCLERKIDTVTFSENLDQFVLGFNIHGVVLTPSQSKLYVEVWGNDTATSAV